MLNGVRWLLAIAIALPCIAGPATATDRIALVIGNGNYATAPLQFAGNDAEDMAEALRNAGFAVTKGIDLDTVAMRRAISGFAEQVGSAKVVLFYFAGHGVQVSDSKNYLLPIDVRPDSNEADIQQGINVQGDLMKALASTLSRRITIVILDACRLPAQSKSAAVDLALTSTRIGGMARMEVPSGTLVAYASAPNTRAAEDPNSKHGRYTSALLRYLPMAGLAIEQVFKRTRSDVEAASDGQQSPREESALRGDQEFTFVERDSRPVAGKIAVIPASVPPAGKPRNAGSPGTGFGDALLASIRATPRERRVRELRRLLETRTTNLQPADVREILRSYWMGARTRVLTLIDPLLPRTFSNEDAVQFLHLLDRRDLAELLARWHGERRLGAEFNIEMAMSDSLRLARQNRACVVTEGVDAESKIPHSNVAAEILGSFDVNGAQMERGLHELLQKNDIQLSFADALGLLRQIPATHRSSAFGELVALFPDRVTPAELGSLSATLRESGNPNALAMLDLATRFDRRIPTDDARANIRPLLGAIADYYITSYFKFCPENESAVQFVTSLKLTQYEYLYLAKAGSYWDILDAKDRLAFVASRPPGEKIKSLKDVMQSQPYVKFGITEIDAALGAESGDLNLLMNSLSVAASNQAIRKPVTDPEVAIVRAWFPGRDGERLVERLKQ